MAGVGRAGLLLLLSLSLVCMGGSRTLRGGHGKAAVPASASSDEDATAAVSCYPPDSTLGLTRERYPFCHVLSEGRVVLYWSHGQGAEVSSDKAGSAGGRDSSRQDGGSITFALAAKTTSWLALGLSNEGLGMKGLDVAMLVPLEDGGFRLEDRHATDYATPELDASQDKSLLWAWRRSGVTAFSFSMPVSSCHDPEEDAAVAKDRYTNVLWAHGTEGQRSVQFHDVTSRGGEALPLMVKDQPRASRLMAGSSGGPPAGLPPADAKSFTITLPNVAISDANVTNYWCMWVEGPTDDRYYVYDNQFVQDPRTRGLVHHAQLYDCQHRQPSAPLNTPFPCFDKNELCPLVSAYDRNSTMPSPALMAEADVALAFAANTSKYWLLEVHLENPKHLSGVVDASGFSLTYSHKPRRHDMGMLLTGATMTVPSLNLTSELVLPPGSPSYDYVSICPSSCTSKKLPPGGSWIMGGRLHMHYHATGGAVELWRADGSRVTVLQSRQYDPSHQLTDLLTSPIALLPGDRIITTCTYDTSNDTTAVVWGPRGREDEMCLAYLHFYPANTPFLSCFNMEGVKQELLQKVVSMHPERSYGVCADKAGATLSNMMASTVLVPPEEAALQKELRAKSSKLGEIKAAAAASSCAP